jgi:hypothetical protein
MTWPTKDITTKLSPPCGELIWKLEERLIEKRKTE